MMTPAHLGAKAVADSANLLDAQVAESLDALHNDGVDGRGRVRVLAIRALGDPFDKVKVTRAVQ